MAKIWGILYDEIFCRKFAYLVSTHTVKLGYELCTAYVFNDMASKDILERLYLLEKLYLMRSGK